MVDRKSDKARRLDMTDFLHGNVDNIQLQLQDPNGNQDSAVEEPTVRSDIVVGPRLSHALPMMPCAAKTL